MSEVKSNCLRWDDGFPNSELCSRSSLTLYPCATP